MIANCGITILQLKSEVDLEEAMQTWDSFRTARENELREIEKAEKSLKRKQ